MSVNENRTPIAMIKKINNQLGIPRSAALLAFSFGFIVSLIYSSNRHVPIVWADEMGYIGIARYLSGQWPMVNMGGTAFYHFGYALIIAPLFWVFTKMESIYTAGVLINDVLVGGIAYYAFRVAYRGTKDVWNAVLIAMIVVLYPSVLLNAGLLWSETIFCLTFIVLIEVAFKLVDRPNCGNAILLVLIAAFGLAIHPRGMALPLISIVFIGYLVTQKRLSYFALGASLVVMMCAWIAVSKVNEHILSVGWSRENWNPLDSRMSAFLNADGVAQAVLSAMRQLWYLTVSSFGVFPACVAILGIKFWKAKSELIGRHPGSQAVVHLFACAAFLSIFLASALQMLVPSRLDHYIYARYVEPTMPAILALGLPYVMGYSNVQAIWRYALSFIVLASILTGLVIAHVPDADGSFAIFNAPLVAIGFDYTDLPNAVLRLSLISIASFALLVLVRNVIGVRVAIFMVALMMLFSAGVVRREFDGFAKGVRQRTDAFRHLIGGPVRAVVAIDLDTVPDDLFYHYQMYRPGWSFIGFNSRSEAAPDAQILIAGLSSAAIGGGASWKPVMFDNQVDVGVFALKPALFDVHMKSGNILDANVVIDYLPEVTLKGFYSVEIANGVSWRWTSGTGSIHFDSGSAKICGVNLSLVSANSLVNKVNVVITNGVNKSIQLTPGIVRNDNLKFAPLTGSVDIGMLSGTFDPGGSDNRSLGVMVRSLSVVPCD